MKKQLTNTLLLCIIIIAGMPILAHAKTTNDVILLPNPLQVDVDAQGNVRATPKKKALKEKKSQSDIRKEITQIVTVSILGRGLRAMMGLVGSIALVMFMYGGYVWLTSAGQVDRINKGKDTIIWASVGLVIIFVSTAAVQAVITTLTR